MEDKVLAVHWEPYPIRLSWDKKRVALFYITSRCSLPSPTLLVTAPLYLPAVHDWGNFPPVTENQHPPAQLSPAYADLQTESDIHARIVEMSSVKSSREVARLTFRNLTSVSVRSSSSSSSPSDSLPQGSAGTFVSMSMSSSGFSKVCRQNGAVWYRLTSRKNIGSISGTDWTRCLQRRNRLVAICGHVKTHLSVQGLYFGLNGLWRPFYRCIFPDAFEFLAPWCKLSVFVIMQAPGICHHLTQFSIVAWRSAPAVMANSVSPAVSQEMKYLLRI